ncbi:MAG: hypothetical protein QX197_03005 [Methylococcaceae bacterium]
MTITFLIKRRNAYHQYDWALRLQSLLELKTLPLRNKPEKKGENNRKKPMKYSLTCASH